MNLFKSLLFLEGYITDPRVLDDDLGPSYGNKRASERSFRDEFAEPAFGRRDADSKDACSAGGCA